MISLKTGGIIAACVAAAAAVAVGMTVSKGSPSDASGGEGESRRIKLLRRAFAKYEEALKGYEEASDKVQPLHGPEEPWRLRMAHTVRDDHGRPIDWQKIGGRFNVERKQNAEARVLRAHADVLAVAKGLTLAEVGAAQKLPGAKAIPNREVYDPHYLLAAWKQYGSGSR